MNILCLQSILSSVNPLDLGVMGVPGSIWMRDALTWMRRVVMAGGVRAVIAGTLLLVLSPLARYSPDRQTLVGR